MRYCNKCNIDYNNNITKCILCNNPLKSTRELLTESYPNYKKPSILKKILFLTILFINLLSIVTIVIIDILINKQLTYSLYVATSNIYIVFFVYILLKRTTFVFKLISLFFLSLAFIISIGIYNQNIYWVLDYAMPFILIINTFILSLVLLSVKRKYEDYIMLLLVSILSNISLITFTISQINKTIWPTLISFIYGIITLLVLIIFTPRDLKEEIKRRFHI